MIKFYDEEGIISPEGTLVWSRESTATTAITAFSDHIFNEFKNRYNAVQVAYARGGMEMPVYEMTVQGKKILLYRSYVGAPAAVSAAEEILAAGIKNIIAFGICGALVDVPPRTFIIPTEAFRDEGTSYHYVKDSKSIKVKNAAFVDGRLTEYGLATLTGGVWTTDGFYRETRTRRDEMRANGCIAVDMECSALQAVCDFRGKNFYTFFITADSLAGEEWEPNYILDVKLAATDSVGIAAAIKLATELD